MRQINFDSMYWYVCGNVCMCVLQLTSVNKCMLLKLNVSRQQKQVL